MKMRHSSLEEMGKRMKIRSMRVLRAMAELHEFENVSTRQLAEKVGNMFHKVYPEHEVSRSCDELVTLGFMDRAGTDASSRFTITDQGQTLASTVMKLAARKPDDWRRFTRPSYSANVMAS